ncbi:ribosomal RNA small subunit methyltransferase A [Candidatus Gracilibacteria bacterium]|nr:ribosomal RNA small subunit methyltransferase A [Candidatus Gracilibacteria bacterium]
MNFEILKKYGIKAKKSLGQNFLIDENILDTIASTLDIAEKNVLEIGPGYGALTEKLLELKPKSLHLVELDKEMIEILEKRKENGELNVVSVDFQIFNKDVLKFEPKFEDEEYYVIANIPYYITSPILQKFLYKIENKPEKMLILMQKDVGDKILQGQNIKNKKNKSSVLSLFIAKKAYVNEIIKVSANCFVPAPKVESSALLFETHDNYRETDDLKFLEFIKVGFQEPRKKLVNNLSKGGYEKSNLLKIFDDLGFKEDIRGEDLSIDEWVEVYRKCL